MLVEGIVGDVEKTLLQRFVIDIFGPKIGISSDHAVEGQDFSSAVLVHHLQPYPHVFRLSFLDDAVAELGVVGGGDFLNVEEDALVTNDVIGHVMHIMDGRVVADVAGYDAAVGDAYRNSKIVVLKYFVSHFSDSAHPEEMVVADHVGVECVGNPDFVPIGCCIAVFHQPFNLIGMQMTPPVGWFFYL